MEQLLLLENDDNLTLGENPSSEDYRLLPLDVLADRDYHNETDDQSSSGSSDSQIIMIKAIMSIFICVFGLIGNALSIFVIVVLKEYKKSILHAYVLQLAIADTLFLLTLPFKVSEDFENQWIFPEWLCKAKESILFLNYYASILFLVVMSLDRYIAVCHSFSTRLLKLRQPFAATIITIGVWILSIFGCVPAIKYTFLTGIQPTCKCSYEFPEDSDYYNSKILDVLGSYSASTSYCTSPFEKDEFIGENEGTESSEELGSYAASGDFILPSYDDLGTSRFYFEQPDLDEYAVDTTSYSMPIGDNCKFFPGSSGWNTFLYFNFIAMFLLPILIMGIAYGLVILRLHMASLRSSNYTSGTSSHGDKVKDRRQLAAGKNAKNRQRVTIMCATLVICFVVCWLPNHAVNLAMIAGIQMPPSKNHICINLRVMGTLLGYLNSALNPYLYSFIGTNFVKRWRIARRIVRRASSRKLRASQLKQRQELKERRKQNPLSFPTSESKFTSKRSSKLATDQA